MQQQHEGFVSGFICIWFSDCIFACLCLVFVFMGYHVNRGIFIWLFEELFYTGELSPRSPSMCEDSWNDDVRLENDKTA